MSQTTILDHFSPRRSRRTAAAPRVVVVDDDSDASDAIDRVVTSESKLRPVVELRPLSRVERAQYGRRVYEISSSPEVVPEVPKAPRAGPSRVSVVVEKRRPAARQPPPPPPPDTDSDTHSPPRKRPRKRAASPDSDSPPRRTPRRPKRTAKRADPDESDEDMVADIQLDESARFATDSRLRRKAETAIQRQIRKARNQRLGIYESETESEEEDDSAESVASSDFIEQDGDTLQDILPHEFSRNATQSPEYKFKVVFHYLLMLVMKGPRFLPLRGELRTYFDPMLQDVRRRLVGFKESRVRSQIWKTDFVRALERMPIFETSILPDAEPGCDACNISTRMSKYKVEMRGEPYNRDTHQPLDSSDGSDDDDEFFIMGKYCHRRAEAFHALSHWEDVLYDNIRGYYHDLLRAMNKPIEDDSDDDSDVGEDQRRRTARRVAKLREKPLPSSERDVDDVLVWMDKRGYQRKEFEWMEGLEKQARLVEHDNARDE